MRRPLKRRFLSAGLFVVQIGLVSTWLEENMAVGGEIKFRGVDGDFTLDKAATCIPPAGELCNPSVKLSGKDKHMRSLYYKL